jgi:hypothetical protein
MKRFLTTAAAVVIAVLPILTGCNMDAEPADTGGDYIGDGKGDGGGENQQGGGAQPGIVTAGEWNDLKNWQFWENLLTKEDYSDMPSHWGFHTNNRVSVLVVNDAAEPQPVANAKVEIKQGGATLSAARTNN